MAYVPYSKGHWRQNLLYTICTISSTVTHRSTVDLGLEMNKFFFVL
uniref:Uncharacterized protein n=1 Tax=Anguilla anguilla TaxID=7936 RepID=A0A0E9RAW6_ANGAN